MVLKREMSGAEMRIGLSRVGGAQASTTGAELRISGAVSAK